MKISHKILYIALLVGGVGAAVALETFVFISAIAAHGWLKITLTAVAGLVFMLWLGVAMHEFGHLIFGKIGGMKFKSISFPFVKAVAVNGKIRLSFFAPKTYLGYTEMIPKAESDHVRAFALMAAGGPLGSLAALAISVLFLALAPFISHYPAIFFGTAAFLLYVIFLENAFPATVNGARTDGAQFYEITKGTDSGKVLAAVLAVQAGYREGYSPAAIPWNTDNLPVLPEDDPYFVLRLNAEYLRALDADDLPALKKAHLRLVDILPRLPEVYAEAVACDLFYDSLTFAPDPAFVEENAGRVLKHLAEEDDVGSCRIRAYYRYAMGDVAAALAEIEKGRSLAPAYAFPGIAEMELRLISRLENTISENTPPESTPSAN